MGFGAANAQPLPLRIAHHAVQGIRIPSGAGVFLVESVASADASRVGNGSPHPGQRRRQLHLVAVTNALAESEQPPRSPAVFRKHESAFGERLQADASSIGARHLRLFRHGQRRGYPAKLLKQLKPCENSIKNRCRKPARNESRKHSRRGRSLASKDEEAAEQRRGHGFWL